jgi:hypothetical protein
MTEENVRIPEVEVEVYCKKYLETFSRTEAYKAVHPNCTHDSAVSNGLKYFNYPKIQEYLIEMIRDKVMSSDELRTQLSNIARFSKKDSDRIRALELIGKTHGLFVDRTDITTKGDKLSWGEYLEKINQETNKESS